MNELPKKMRGVFLTGHGGLDKLEIRNDISAPRPGPYDVLIQVRAAAVNNTVLEKGVFANLVRRIEQDDIVPVVDKTFPLDQIAEAQKYFVTKQHTGKIVLTLTDSEQH
jgi:NADPH:quinone reductase-like Zn-dependent oxidoreductase